MNQAVTLEDLKSARDTFAGMIATFEAQAKAESAFPLTIERPELKTGETWIGTIVKPDGTAEHSILLPGDNAAATWQEQMDWAKEQGGDLPNRIEQAMLVDRFKDEFKKEYYWSNTQHAGNSVYAWVQLFGNGGQGNLRKSSKFRARAVRRISASVL